MRLTRKAAAANLVRVFRLASKNVPTEEIGRRLKLARATVYRLIHKLGLKPTPSVTPPLSDRKAVLRLVDKVGVAKAAKQLKVSRNAIYLRLAQWRSETA